MSCVDLTHRSLVRIAGDEAEQLLQDVITCDVVGLLPGIARVGALLTPQGKILFEFLISRTGEDGFLLDIDDDQVKPFISRMTMYRLRAKAAIEPVDTLGVAACWACPPTGTLIVDERFRDGQPVFRRYEAKSSNTKSDDDYARLRIDGGVSEAGRDYGLSEAFPHDVLMDLNNGVSLTKGCYVGQEVVSRMQHRGTARRRVVQVTGEIPLPASGTSITANERVIGTLGTVVGAQGLALVRVDRVAKALAEHMPVMTDGVPISLSLPSWTGLSFPTTDADN